MHGSAPLRFVLLLSVLLATATFAQTAPFTRTVIVNNTGMPAVDGTALLGAVAGLVPAPSATNRWVIQLEGGTYDVGTATLDLPAYVSLLGVGIDVSTIVGSSGPSAVDPMDSVVATSDFSTLRDLTVACQSEAGVEEECLALNTFSASPRLEDVKVSVGGTGAGAHFGMVAGDGEPVIEDVEIVVDAPSAPAAFGLFFTGASAKRVTMTRSEVRVQNGQVNRGLVLDGDLERSVIEESTIEAIGGTDTAAVAFFSSTPPTVAQALHFNNCYLRAYAGSGVNLGIADQGASPATNRLFLRGGLLFATTDGIVMPDASVSVLRSEINVPVGGIAVSGAEVGIASTWVRAGSVAGSVSATCAVIFRNDFTFLPDTCP